ncbi:MAG TPA: histidine kinase dimerization/phosphoacceptor domain -containing protein [Microvirga sp.]|nr:histidine kinase dimerization/phosphoacceptor domain -containing protein [Microvirga sp.]
MVKRQKVLADFGEFALRCTELDAILTEACRLVGDALGTDLAKVLEIEHDEQRLFMRAGVGWKPGLVGRLRLPLNRQSSETYSIQAGKPVITQDISKEDRFEFPDFLKENGAVAIVNVPIFLPGGKPYGLLQVDSREPRDFGEEDIEFLRTYATILGPVIDRLHKAYSLKEALDANQRLLQELQHRIKNHIGIISSLIQMRTRAAHSEEARQELTAIGERIDTLRLLHEQLYIAGTADCLRLRPFVMQLVENLCHLHQGQSGKVRLDFAIEEVELSPELAVPLGLVLNEFVTNSLKYAFDGQGGVIAVAVEALANDRMRVRISDNGKGLPSEPRPPRPGSGTGMRLIEALARQMDAEPDWSSSEGTTLSLEFTRR